MYTNLQPAPKTPLWERLLWWMRESLLPSSLTTLVSLSRWPAADPTEELEALFDTPTSPRLEWELEVDPDAATVMNFPTAAFSTLVPSALDWDASQDIPLELRTRRLKG